MFVFDAHSDILTDVVTHRLAGEKDVLNSRHMKRLASGGVEGSILVLWVEPKFNDNPLVRMHEVMDIVQDELSESDAVKIVYNYDEIMEARKSGRFYALLGVEGLVGIGDDVDKIDMLYDYGIRHAGLTWNEQNPLATGVLGNPERGLTDAGRKAVRRIQDKHMLMDVSHANEKSFWDIMKVATEPVIASHSNCKVLCDVPRNLTDDQLRAIKDTGGVVGLNSFRLFVNPDKEKQNVEFFAKHADHMINVMGIEHVGCGFDFIDYFDEDTRENWMERDEKVITDGIGDASEIPNLIQCFRKMGLTEEEIEKIAYKNYHNIIRRVIG